MTGRTQVEVEVSRDEIIEMMFESDDNPNWPNPCKASFLAPRGSLTEAMVQLGEAALAWQNCPMDFPDKESEERWSALLAQYESALARVRELSK